MEGMDENYMGGSTCRFLGVFFGGGGHTPQNGPKVVLSVVLFL